MICERRRGDVVESPVNDGGGEARVKEIGKHFERNLWGKSHQNRMFKTLKQ